MKTRFHLAILIDPNETDPPSTYATIQKLADMANRQGVSVSIGDADFLNTKKYDALFIRQTTAIGNSAYWLSKKAALKAIPVIDDYKSIECCCNKLVMMNRLSLNSIPTPISQAISLFNFSYDTFSEICKQVDQIGYPVVLKDPATFFSRGVHRARNEAELWAVLKKLSGTKDNLIQLQKYMPTRFDWRIGILDHQVIYVCQYNMVPNHWQIVRHNDDGSYDEGDSITLPPEHWPSDICEIAIRAAACAGHGLYGVDIKETRDGPMVIEVNDNPTIDAEDEDRYSPVWESILGWFRSQVINQRGGRSCSASLKSPESSLQAPG